jgi:hypothetical protein
MQRQQPMILELVTTAAAACFMPVAAAVGFGLVASLCVRRIQTSPYPYRDRNYRTTSRTRLYSGHQTPSEQASTQALSCNQNQNKRIE